MPKSLGGSPLSSVKSRFWFCEKAVVSTGSVTRIVSATILLRIVTSNFSEQSRDVRDVKVNVKNKNILNFKIGFNLEVFNNAMQLFFY